MRKPLLLSFILVSLAAAVVKHKHRVPVLNLSSDNEVYHGTVKENDRVVSLSPPVSVIDGSGPICSYVILKNGNGEIPFEITVTDKEAGTVELRAKKDARLDCKNSPYRFQIAAERCKTNSRSDSASVEITVEDTNDHAPEFEKAWYTVDVDEGRLYGEIVRLKATDQDCGHPYGEICRYEITNNAAPFTVTQEGVLKNTQPLNYTVSHSHILSVVAHDCGMKRSKSVLVTVKVREHCELGLQGISDRVEYYPGAGSKSIASKATLNLCDVSCEVEKVEGTIRLRTDHIGQGCDRGNFASPAQRKSCGADEKTVELLPKPDEDEILTKSTEEDKDNEVMEEGGSLDNVYLFDGEKNAVVVPPETAKPMIPRNFSLSFWMKHDKHKKTSGHFKENILCSSDDHKMNRHHFSVYLRNCKLELLMRTEASEVSKKEFMAAEWRWRLAEVCDNEWHHYAVNMEYPQVTLEVDGKAFTVSENNPELLDDYPIHAVKEMKTRMVIGACWQGRTSRMGQFFKGYLLGMLYLPGKTESPGVMQCLHQCKEQLEFNGLDQLKPGETAVFKNDESEVTLGANSVEEFSRMLRTVSYVNLRDKPTPGHRGFSIQTNLRCKKNPDPIDVPDVKGFIFVKEAPKPTLKISGDPVIVRTRGQAHDGTNILPDMKIVVTQPKGEGGEMRDTTTKHKLDWCHIKVRPKLDKDQEYFSSPAALIGSLHLDFEHDRDGLLLKGIEKVKGYQQVLSQIHYFNLHPQQYPKRIFVVQCSMLNGRVRSNEFPVSMSIKAAPKPPPLLKKSEKHESEVKMQLHKEPEFHKPQPVLHRLKETLKMETRPVRPNVGPLPSILHEAAGYSKSDPATGGMWAGGLIAIVVVVCIGFLLVVIVVGILKMRAKPVGRRRGSGKYHRPGQEGEGDLAWDDSGMNITVNPILVKEHDSVADEEVGQVEEFTDDDSSDDDGDSFRDDEDEMSEDEDDDEVEEVLPHVSSSRQGSTGLEWDDSTLRPNTHTPSAKTYRV